MKGSLTQEDHNRCPRLISGISCFMWMGSETDLNQRPVSAIWREDISMLWMKPVNPFWNSPSHASRPAPMDLNTVPMRKKVGPVLRNSHAPWRERTAMRAGLADISTQRVAVAFRLKPSTEA